MGTLFAIDMRIAIRRACIARDGFADEEINGICTLLRGQPLEQR
jgi:hypothetical protein